MIGWIRKLRARRKADKKLVENSSIHDEKVYHIYEEIPDLIPEQCRNSNSNRGLWSRRTPSPTGEQAETNLSQDCVPYLVVPIEDVNSSDTVKSSGSVQQPIPETTDHNTCFQQNRPCRRYLGENNSVISECGGNDSTNTAMNNTCHVYQQNGENNECDNTSKSTEIIFDDRLSCRVMSNENMCLPKRVSAKLSEGTHTEHAEYNTAGELVDVSFTTVSSLSFDEDYSDSEDEISEEMSLNTTPLKENHAPTHRTTLESGTRHKSQEIGNIRRINRPRDFSRNRLLNDLIHRNFDRQMFALL